MLRARSSVTVAGIGRSGAAGLAILADRLEPGNEADALAQLLTICPQAVPNLRLTAAAGEPSAGAVG